MTVVAETRSDAGIEPHDADRRVDCAIVVVTHNSEHHIGAFLESIADAAGPLTWQVVVVDNASSDRTVALVGGSERVRCVPTGTNGGYAAGINVGRSLAGECDAILIANPDVRLAPGSIELLQHEVTSGGHGAAVPQLVDRDGRPSRSLRREPTILRQLGEALLGDHLPRRPAWLSEIVREPGAYRRPHLVEWATGAVVMVSARCDEVVGAWDESYFLFSEEVDYASRVRAAGFSIAFVPEATALHDEGGSGRSTSLMGMAAVNRLRYYRSRHGRIASVAFTVALLMQLLVRSADREHRRAAVTVARTAFSAITANAFPVWAAPAGDG